MKTEKIRNQNTARMQSIGRMAASLQGNVLVYLALVILIFGVLGVTIASLFSTATTSSATPNDARRAYYVAESGVRYALSRIRNANFHPDFIKEINNTPKYSLANGSSFTINVFSPWFISASAQDASLNNIFTLSVPNDGKIPQNFSIPSSNVLLTNWNTFRGIPPGNPPLSHSYAEITGSSITAGNTSLTITMNGSDDLVVDVDETVCLAVQPTDTNSTLQAGESIYIAPEAKDFFPSRNGAIRIVTADNQVGEYVYEKMDDETTRMKLTNLAPLPGSSFTEITNFSTDDWVVLSRYNYRVITTGTSGDVTTEIGQNKQVWFFRPLGDWTITEREFIDTVSQKVSDIGNPVAKVEMGITEEEDKVILGGSSPGFGNLWYGGDKPIGGDANFCVEGRCFFQDGIRLFFTLENTGEGEGFNFALIAAGDDGTGNPVNTRDSAGGDFESSELLGYAGDSRRANPPTRDCVDDNNCEGLRSPKFGLEFDTRTQNDATFNQNLAYCSSSNLKQNTRHDPLPDGANEDAVQLIFWGSEESSYSLNIPCRDDSPNKASYDDNRHDAEDFRQFWTFPTGSAIVSSPAVGDDGTIYVGSNDGHLYAVNPDGSSKWTFPNAGSVGTVEASPAIGADGTIYVGSHDGHLYAINPDDGSQKWRYPSFGSVGLIRSSPAIDRTGGPHTGTIYFGSGTQGIDNDGRVFAINPDGTLRWQFTPFRNIDNDVDGSPVLDSAGKIYIGADDSTFYALDPDDRLIGGPLTSNEWEFPALNTVESKAAIDESRATVYVEAEGRRIFAINMTNGAERWHFDIMSSVAEDDDLDSSPAVATDGTIYVGSKEGYLFAINPNGTQKWRFPSFGSIGAVRSSPAIDSNGTVYIGSNDHNLYTLNPSVPDADRLKFSFNTGGDVRSSPAINPGDETVYVGSNDTNLYAFNQLADPRNFRDERAEPRKLVNSEDFPEITFADIDDSNNWLQHGDGLWAVRIEVNYDGLVDGEEQYTFKTWVEKCTESGCSKFLSALYRDTLVNYDVAGIPPKLEQTIKLSAAEHDKFERILFGFTTAAASGDTQQSIIKFLELSFIRPTDPTVTSDPNL